jgi:hypothetical protein
MQCVSIKTPTIRPSSGKLAPLTYFVHTLPLATLSLYLFRPFFFCKHSQLVVLHVYEAITIQIKFNEHSHPTYLKT